MKRKIAALLGVLFLFSLAVPISMAATPEEIKYDFTSATELNDWKTIGGSWSISDGVLKQTSSTPGAWNMHCALKDVKVKDFTVKIRMRVTKENLGTGWAAFFFRKQKLEDNQEQSGYGLAMEGKSSKGKTYLIDWSHASKTWEEQAVRANGDEWNDIVLAVKGNNITVYLNNDIDARKATISITDTDNGWSNEGFISLAAGNTKIEVDYIYLYTGSAQSKAFGQSAAQTSSVTSKANISSAAAVKNSSANQTSSKTPGSAISSVVSSSASGSSDVISESSVPVEETIGSDVPEESQVVSSEAEEALRNNETEKQWIWIPIVLIIAGIAGAAVVVILYVVSKKRSQ